MDFQIRGAQLVLTLPAGLVRRTSGHRQELGVTVTSHVLHFPEEDRGFLAERLPEAMEHRKHTHGLPGEIQNEPRACSSGSQAYEQLLDERELPGA